MKRMLTLVCLFAGTMACEKAEQVGNYMPNTLNYTGELRNADINFTQGALCSLELDTALLMLEEQYPDNKLRELVPQKIHFIDGNEAYLTMVSRNETKQFFAKIWREGEYMIFEMEKENGQVVFFTGKGTTDSFYFIAGKSVKFSHSSIKSNTAVGNGALNYPDEVFEIITPDKFDCQLDVYYEAPMR